jgi:hypothetical protein
MAMDMRDPRGARQPKVQTQIRMDQRMKRRVRKYIEKLKQKERTELRFGAAVRKLIDQALDREGIQ